MVSDDNPFHVRTPLKQEENYHDYDRPSKKHSIIDKLPCHEQLPD